jgi:hypothetical protein
MRYPYTLSAPTLSAENLPHSHQLDNTLLPRQVTNSLQGQATVILSASPLLLSAYWGNP